LKTKNNFCILLLFLAAVGCGKAQVDKVLNTLNQESLITPGVSAASVLENYEQIIELEYSSSGSTLAESCSITSEVNLSITTPCSCDSGVCTVGITPGTAGVGSFEYSVSTGSTESNSSSYDLTIKTMVPFVSQWNITSGDTVELSLLTGLNYDFNIDWGDGTIESYTEGGTTISHNYGASNTYNVTISGLFEGFGIASSSRSKITSVTELGTVGWKTFATTFAACSNLTTVSGGDTSEVTNMSNMFKIAGQAVPDTSGWDTSKVTDMSNMFDFATSANPNTSGWDTSNVTDMGEMFASATVAEPDTSGWDTSKVTNMYRMFMWAEAADPDTSGWDTSNVTNMRDLFYKATSANPDVSGWDTSSVTTMQGMFAYTELATPDTSGFDTSQVTTMRDMFSHSLVANPDTSGWNTSKVENMRAMFHTAGAADPDMSGWDFSSATVIYEIFQDNTSLSTANYNTLLMALDQTATQAFHLDAGDATYTIGSPGEAAYQSLDSKGWGFEHGGGI
tara:strand:+ start:132031 stop:133554 length:1524 start_codon:yes stop_codon:yes gene_type:complete